ncbi:MAG: hypothetical protein KGI75_00925 [Rhizobiaceae bacterium]|nr:hypothetical protein [Rhizobiaceae bacterium]
MRKNFMRAAIIFVALGSVSIQPAAASGPQKALLCTGTKNCDQSAEGTVTWSPIAMNSFLPADGIQADVSIPDHQLGLTVSFRRNFTVSLPASHVIELTFKQQPANAFGGIAEIEGVAAVGDKTTPLAAVPAKVSDTVYMIGLVDAPDERRSNMAALCQSKSVGIRMKDAGGHELTLLLEEDAETNSAFHQIFAK